MHLTDLGLLLASLAAAGCGGSDGTADAASALGSPAETGAASPDSAIESIRSRSRAQFDEGDFERAYETLRPLLERPDPALEDSVSGGALLLARDQLDEAAALAERAAAQQPDDPAVQFLQANVLRRQLDFAGAAALYRRVLLRLPDDNAVRWLLAESLDAQGLTDEPVAIWEQMRAQGFAQAGPFYLGAIYRLGGDLIQRRRPAEGLALRQESANLQKATGVKPVDAIEAEKLGPGRMSRAPRDAGG